MAKERLTISFIVNAAGGKEPPIIIGKIASPLCFKGVQDKTTTYGLPYFSNPKACMNTEIMNVIFIKIKQENGLRR